MGEVVALLLYYLLRLLLCVGSVRHPGCSEAGIETKVDERTKYENSRLNQLQLKKSSPCLSANVVNQQCPPRCERASSGTSACRLRHPVTITCR